jgi:hypothetical protein
MNQVPSSPFKVSRLKKPFLWMVLIGALAFMAFRSGLLVATPHGIIRTADAGFRKAKQTINPEDLRAWALESLKHWSNTNDEISRIPRSEIPTYIRDLYSDPAEAVVFQGENYPVSSITILWGGGFFHWAIQIGPTNFVRQPNPVYPRVFMWVPGIYYTREGDQDLQ